MGKTNLRMLITFTLRKSAMEAKRARRAKKAKCLLFLLPFLPFLLPALAEARSNSAASANRCRSFPPSPAALRRLRQRRIHHLQQSGLELRHLLACADGDARMRGSGRPGALIHLHQCL